MSRVTIEHVRVATAYAYEDDIFCQEHLPRGITPLTDGVSPCYADVDQDFYPVCGVCGREHDEAEVVFEVLPPARKVKRG